MTFRFVRRVTTATFVLLSALAAAAAPIDELQKIKDLPVIRIGMERGGGNGHQSATLTLVQRLRELGYRGKIEVVYDESNLGKLVYLVPGFSIFTDQEQYFADRNLSLVSYENFKDDDQSYPTAELVLLGATDEPVPLKKYRTTTLLTLQPYTWSYNHSVLSRFPKVGIVHRPIPNLYRKGYVWERPNQENAAQIIKQEMSRQATLAEKVDGLVAIFDRLKSVDFAPLYGHHMEYGQGILYAAGLKNAMDREPRLFHRPAVLPVFNNLDSRDRSTLKKMIKQDAYFRSFMQTIDITDPELTSKMDRLGPGQILLVDVGSVTKSVFELFFGLATLPPIVEGRNSMNLMHLIGKPYLYSHQAETYQFHNAPSSASAASASIAEVVIVPRLTAQMSVNVANFLIDSRQTDSVVNKAFTAQKIAVGDVTQDKLYVGLVEANRHIELISKGRRPSIFQKASGHIHSMARRLADCVQILSSRE